MRTRALIIVGGGGWGRQAIEIVPGLEPSWDKTYVTPCDNAKWYASHPLDGPLHFVHRLQPAHRRPAVMRALGLVRCLIGVTWVMLRVRPHVILGICSDLSIPVMAMGRLLGCTCFFVETLTRVEAPSRAARLLDRYGLADRIYVQHESMLTQLARADWPGGIL